MQLKFEFHLNWKCIVTDIEIEVEHELEVGIKLKSNWLWHEIEIETERYNWNWDCLDWDWHGGFEIAVDIETLRTHLNDTNCTGNARLANQRSQLGMSLTSELKNDLEIGKTFEIGKKLARNRPQNLGKK